jgi:lactoylglutathione lyase
MKYLWTTIHVKDLEESVKFYRELMGLQVLQRFPAGPGVEIAFLHNTDMNETQIELLCNQNETIAFTESITLGFAVESIDRMLELLEEKSITVINGIVETPKYKWITIKDPNGAVIQFFEQK